MWPVQVWVLRISLWNRLHFNKAGYISTLLIREMTDPWLKEGDTIWTVSYVICCRNVCSASGLKYFLVAFYAFIRGVTVERQEMRGERWRVMCKNGWTRSGNIVINQHLKTFGHQGRSWYFICCEIHSGFFSMQLPSSKKILSLYVLDKIDIMFIRCFMWT